MTSKKLDWPYTSLDRRARNLDASVLAAYLSLQDELIARGEKQAAIKKMLGQFLDEREARANQPDHTKSRKKKRSRTRARS